MFQTGAYTIKGRAHFEERETELRALIAKALFYVEAFPIKGPMYKDAHKAARIIKTKAADMAAGVLISPADRSRLESKIKADRERRAAAEKERAIRVEAARAEAMEQMDKWIAGVPDVRAPSYYMPGLSLPTKLRIKGAAVETSRGAVVSVRAARILWAMIKAGRDIIGHVIDGYTVTASDGALVIGCHTIDRAEVERLGALLDARDAEKGGVE